MTRHEASDATPRRGRHGSSLVEALVCLSLAAVVFGSIATLFLQSRRSNDAAEKYSIASALVRDRLEQLLCLRFD
ncbi:MAG TPA: hypothetical protein VIY96_08270, partial [Thermoanaerobaculia bacterium]